MSGTFCRKIPPMKLDAAFWDEVKKSGLIKFEEAVVDQLFRKYHNFHPDQLFCS